jgi:hypothetical protein
VGETKQTRVKLSFEQIKALGLKKGMRIDARSASGRFIDEVTRVSPKVGKVKVYTGRHTEDRDIRYFEITIQTERGAFLEETFYEINVL